MFIVYFLYENHFSWKKKLPIKAIVISAVLFVVIIYLFWFVKNIIGRSSQDDIVPYIARYLGGSYELFDMYLQSPPSVAHETFGYFVQSFNKLGLTNIDVRLYHEFRVSTTGVLIGNVYSGLRNYYNDFGLFGVFMLSMTKSMVLTYFYYKVRCKKIYKNLFLLILYSTWIYVFVFEFFVDYFYARFSIGYFVEIFVMYMIYYVTCKKQIRVKWL